MQSLGRYLNIKRYLYLLIILGISSLLYFQNSTSVQAYCTTFPVGCTCCIPDYMCVSLLFASPCTCGTPWPSTVCSDGSRTCGSCPPPGGTSSGSSSSGCGPVDGGWGGWSGCNNCQQTRSCDNPSPSCGGANCSGSSTQACQSCGDGQKCGSEACDDGNANNCDNCGNNCTLRYCGDGILCGGAPHNEQCDQGGGNSNQPNQYCRTNCRLARCGDGIRDTGFRAIDGVPLREECDDGNTNNRDACDNNCKLTTTVVPWVATLDGGVYATNGFSGFTIQRVDTMNPPINNASYKYNYTNPATLSEYLASVGNSNLPGANYLSENNYVNTQYKDLGTNPSAFLTNTDSWYSYYKTKISNTNPIATIGTNTISGNISTALGVGANSFVVRERVGNLTLNSGTVCNIKGVILVSGNLVINPDLTINTVTNGCIYIVQGNVNIRQGTRKNAANLISIEPTDYDIVEGMFVVDGTFVVEADDFSDGRKADGLFLRGGVITQAVDLDRYLEGFNDVVQPAEIYINDPRYLGITQFRALFDQRRFSIREI